MFKSIHKMKVREDRGFTLVELLIVVAIIGILAAIAIPQFAAYRIRGFNAAANSDVRNVGTAEEALFADSQGYGSIANAVLAPAAAVAGPTAPLGGPLNGALAATAGTLVRNAQGAVAFSLSNGVSVSSANTISAAPVLGTSYLVVAKNTNGDACFGRESDSTAMYRATHQAGVALLVADVPASVLNTIDLSGAGVGACDNWAVQ